MKNLLFLFCFFLVGSMSLNAQKACAKKDKACCAKKSAMKADAKDTKVASATMAATIEAADALAESSENIEKRVNAATGDVTYYEKSTCEVSGNVKWSEVKYCEKSNKFTQVASASMEKDIEMEATEGAKDAKKACSSKDEKKACCSGKKGAKSCSKKEKTEK